MLKLTTILCLLCTFASVSHAGKRDTINFDTDIIPILTKAGCNSGACHGAAAGRGEFHLSLYGSNPAFDYDSIVHRFKGRRVNLVAPENSLLLLKPTETLIHGGGTRIELDGPGFNLLTEWIAKGAERLENQKLNSFKITPSHQVFESIGDKVTLQATAKFSDGRKHNVTRWTVLTPEDDMAVQIDPESGEATALRPGRHVVIARYLDRVVPIIFIVPLQETLVDLADAPRVNFIDDHIYDLLKTLKIPPSPVADDATFLRRITLNLTGRLPAPDVVQAFLDDLRENKRQLLIDELLNSEEFNDYWTYKFAKLLRIRSQPLDDVGARTYHTWLREQIAAAAPYNEIVEDLLTSIGDSHTYGPANFYRTVGGPRALAEFVSELFLGSRLRCANCHDHPLDHWKQDDYHGLAAIFANVKAGRVISIQSGGEVIHPRTGVAALKRIPGEQFLDNAAQGRTSLTDWITSNDNPYFAKAIVNRLWKNMMGRGLIEPTDDLRSTNPATHPELLDFLAKDFIAHDYNLRHTLRVIANSAAYARSEKSLPENETDDRFYSHALGRPLEPEVLADAIADVTGITMQFGEEPASTRAITLFDPNIASPALDILGRCVREESCESQSSDTAGLPVLLHLMNGKLLNERIQSPKSRLSLKIKENDSIEEIIREFYLLALSRLPTDEEQQFWKKELGPKQDKQRVNVLQDFVWALLTSQEFVTNH